MYASDYLNNPPLTSREKRMREAFRAIAAIADPPSGDKGPIRQARHIAKCILAEIDGKESSR